jgi:hypothetical protein
MADVTTALKAATGNSQRGRNVYMVENTLDFANITADPSASDVVQAITIPAGTMIMAAGMEVVTSITGANGTDVVAALGTDLDPNKFVDGFDLDGAAAGAYAPSVTGTGGNEVHGTANTLDVTLTATNADGMTSGKLRVWCAMMDVTEMGDTSADEVDRDQLA